LAPCPPGGGRRRVLGASGPAFWAVRCGAEVVQRPSRAVSSLGVTAHRRWRKQNLMTTSRPMRSRSIRRGVQSGNRLGVAWVVLGVCIVGLGVATFARVSLGSTSSFCWSASDGQRWRSGWRSSSRGGLTDRANCDPDRHRVTAASGDARHLGEQPRRAPPASSRCAAAWRSRRRSDVDSHPERSAASSSVATVSSSGASLTHVDR
jgi:hypothetical protein